MIDYRFDDGGRRVAGYKGEIGDCFIRAVAILTGEPYKRVYKRVLASMKAHGYTPTGDPARAKNVLKPDEVLSSHEHWRGQKALGWVLRDCLRTSGLVNVPLPPGARPTYSEAYQRYGNCAVVSWGYSDGDSHIAAIVDGVLQDTFDSRLTESGSERKARMVWAWG